MDNIKKAAILTIGDELMIGQIVDTNSAWIASFLDQHGWQVTRKLGVRDDIPQKSLNDWDGNQLRCTNCNVINRMQLRLSPMTRALHQVQYSGKEIKS